MSPERGRRSATSRSEGPAAVSAEAAVMEHEAVVVETGARARAVAVGAARGASRERVHRGDRAPLARGLRRPRAPAGHGPPAAGGVADCRDRLAGIRRGRPRCSTGPRAGRVRSGACARRGSRTATGPGRSPRRARRPPARRGPSSPSASAARSRCMRRSPSIALLAGRPSGAGALCVLAAQRRADRLAGDVARLDGLAQGDARDRARARPGAAGQGARARPAPTRATRLRGSSSASGARTGAVGRRPSSAASGSAISVLLAGGDPAAWPNAELALRHHPAAARHRCAASPCSWTAIASRSSTASAPARGATASSSPPAPGGSRPTFPSIPTSSRRRQRPNDQTSRIPCASRPCPAARGARTRAPRATRPVRAAPARRPRAR